MAVNYSTTTGEHWTAILQRHDDGTVSVQLIFDYRHADGEWRSVQLTGIRYHDIDRGYAAYYATIDRERDLENVGRVWCTTATDTEGLVA